jgi:hypothetical protein
MASRVLHSIVSYGPSKRVIKADGFGRSKPWEGRDVDISISSKKIKIMLSGNYSQHQIVYIRNLNILFSSMSGDYISLQAPGQIFVHHLARLGWPISGSLVSDGCGDLIHLTCHNVLFLVIFAASGFLTVSWLWSIQICDWIG